MGILGQYEKGWEDTYKDKKSHPKRVYFDCEGDFVCEIRSLGSGISKNKKNSQRMNQGWIAANMKVVRINSQGEGAEKSQLFEGGPADWHKWLPRQPDPEDMSVKEQFDIAEIHEFGSAIIRLIPDYVTNALVDQLFEDDGKRCVGKLIGVAVVASLADEKKKVKQPDGTIVEEDFYFFNAKFYPVDDEGNRIDPMTPDELRASLANAA